MLAFSHVSDPAMCCSAETRFRNEVLEFAVRLALVPWAIQTAQPGLDLIHTRAQVSPAAARA